MTSSTGSKSPLRSCGSRTIGCGFLPRRASCPSRLEPLLDESNQLVAMLSKAVAKLKGKAKLATRTATSA